MFDVDVSATENYLNVPSLYHVALPPAYSAGARVHSNSWTTYYMSSYTSKSLDVDEFTYDHPDFLFIAGAGNSGTLGYNSVTSPAISKNGIAVGASSENHDNVVYFSSLGSAYDSAYKPNIVTPGRNLQSAGVRMTGQNESCNVEISSGQHLTNLARICS
jgi:serine protease AprX